ncbi:MAG: hypothetical protein GWP08_13020 [Nitrospiraceae bacterium]|nr:hypothetical protein [Nitrospiraceae bacterium]
MIRFAVRVVLLAALATGCATQTGVVRDGETYGVTKGAFRGRWWSYYERGCSYASGGFYTEAEADLRQALVGRTRDAWQARTYGLHFVEYFPNRELGVVSYHAGRLDEAQQYLETSLSQIDTARAHHYLDLVTKARIAKGDLHDANAPTVTMSGTVPVIASRELALDIRATDDIGVARVTVNGRAIPQRGSAAELRFADSALLTEGSHEIAVEARDLADKSTTQTYTVEVDLTGPTIGLFSPRDALVTEDALVHLEGTCVDRNGVVSVTLDGRALEKSEGGKRLDFSSELTLKDGENVFVVTATDVAGNETRSAVRVFKGKPASAAARLWQVRERSPESLRLAGGRTAASLLMTTAAAQDPIVIRIKSPEPDRPYRHNKTLRVSGEVIAKTKVASLEINGEPFETLTGAPKETFNRRIAIDVGVGDDGDGAIVPVKIAAKDDQGHESVQAFDVLVRPVQMDSRESKMPVAILAFAGAGLEPAVTDLLRVSTEAKLVEAGRFRVLDRTRLQDVLTEQQLAAALADPNEAISLGKLTNAHIFLIADVFPRDETGLEIKSRAISTETSDVIATLDVFIEDRNSREAVENACAALAAQLAEVFPRLSGELLAVRPKADGSEMLVNWTKEDGVREGAYLLVVHEDEPWVDETTGEILAEGEIIEVSRGRITRVTSSGSQAKEIKQDTAEVKLEQGMAAITM